VFLLARPESTTFDVLEGTRDNYEFGTACTITPPTNNEYSVATTGDATSEHVFTSYATFSHQPAVSASDFNPTSGSKFAKIAGVSTPDIKSFAMLEGPLTAASFFAAADFFV